MGCLDGCQPGLIDLLFLLDASAKDRTEKILEHQLSKQLLEGADTLRTSGRDAHSGEGGVCCPSFCCSLSCPGALVTKAVKQGLC